MTDTTDGQKLSEHLTNLRDGLQSQNARTTGLENTITAVQNTVTHLEQHLSERVDKLSVSQQSQYQQLDHTIQNLDDQVKDLRHYISNQISELTAELRSTLAAIHTPPSLPSPSPAASKVNDPMNSRPFLNISSSHDAQPPLLSRQTVIVQPPTTAPCFSGKVYEKPRPFLLQLHQYTNSSYGWNREMLFQNIGQFLKGTALEWYTQVLTSISPPTHWDAFQTLFLQQFSSPLRLAQIEQQWKTCTQKSDESINEFLVRLRSLWSEHKPQETERDLVRHLLRKSGRN